MTVYSLDGHLYKTDTLIKWTPRVGPCLSLLPFILTLYNRNITLRACLHGGGGPQVGEVTCGGSPHLSCKMKDYMDWWVTPPKQVTSFIWSPHQYVNRALDGYLVLVPKVAVLKDS